jgi:sugar lactone lactonase YvrE
VRRFLTAGLAAAVVAAIAASALAASGFFFPTKIALPNGFAPEGIAIRGLSFYVGSIPTGAIYRGNLVTGTGRVFVPPVEGRQAIGLDVRRGLLFAAGGPTGRAFVYDARTGADVAQLVLTEETTFVNDVVVTHDAAYFTDSLRQVLYRVPVGRHGSLGEPQEIPLTGDIEYIAGFNVNGIDATRDGSTLILVQSNTGKLFTADPETGVTSEIDLGGKALTAGDGILLDGSKLYVVRNQLNLIAVVRLAPDLSSGEVLREVTHPDFAVPTTVDEFLNRLYVVNARFGTDPSPEVEYWVTGLDKP